MRIFLMALCTSLLLAGSACTRNSGQQQPSRNPSVPLPEIPDRMFSITEFGARGDGVFLNTEAINRAIDSCASLGGGTVLIPEGLWLTGPIQLRSHIELRAEEGALIVFTTRFDDYPLVATSFEGLETMRCTSPIHGRDLTDIAITGKGVFDGSGDAWRPLKKNMVHETQWKAKVASGGVVNAAGNTWYPSEQALKGSQISTMNVPRQFTTEAEFATVKDFLRPVMVSLIQCRNVLLEGVTFQNSPAWCVHPLMCENLTLRGLNIRNPWYSINGDGTDIESCKNVLIEDCRYDVGDDAICIKSGKDEDGRKRGMPTENLTVRRCVVYHGHGGFVVGSEMSGGVRNVEVSHCTFIGTDVGLRFKSTRGRGGVVENINIHDITMIDIPAEAILFDLFYHGQSPVPEPGTTRVEKPLIENSVVPVDETTPVSRNISIRNIVCRNAGRGIFLQGLPEMPLSDVTMDNVFITCNTGMQCADTEGVTLSQVTLLSRTEPVVDIVNSRNIRLSSFTYADSTRTVVRIQGDRNEALETGVPDSLTEIIPYAAEVKR